jgi:hypothetical protein
LAWDQKLIGILSGTAPDCEPQPGGTSPTVRWSVIAVKQSGRGGGGGQKGGATTGLLTKYIKMYIKTSFFEVLSEDKKDSEDVSAGTSIFL